MIGRILEIDKGLVRRQSKWVVAHLDGLSPNGRPSILSQERHNRLIEAISQAYATRVPWTIADVNAYIEEYFRVHLTKQTIHGLLKRDARVKSCRGIPMEDRRAEVASEEISDTGKVITLYSLIVILRHSNVPVRLNHIGSNPLEHAFGKTRLLCRDINTMRNFISGLPAEFLTLQGGNVLHLVAVARRRTSVGVDRDPWGQSAPSFFF